MGASVTQAVRPVGSGRRNRYSTRPSGRTDAVGGDRGAPQVAGEPLERGAVGGGDDGVGVAGEAVDEGAATAGRPRGPALGHRQGQGRLDGLGLGVDERVGLVVAGEVGVAAGEDAGGAADDARGDRFDLDVGPRRPRVERDRAVGMLLPHGVGDEGVEVEVGVDERLLVELGFLVTEPTGIEEITRRAGPGTYRVTAYGFDPPGLRWGGLYDAARPVATPGIAPRHGGGPGRQRHRAWALVGWYAPGVMTVRAELIAEVLTLPEPDREALLRALLDSLDEPGEDKGHAAAWDDEIERRAQADDDGSAELVDGAEVFRQVRAEIDAHRP